MRTAGSALRTLAATAVLGVAVAGCKGNARPAAEPENPDAALRVVTTTEVLADLVREVGGDRVQVNSIVPPGGDPHSYEPTPADANAVSKADVTFTNHLLLEERALIKTVDSNARKGTPNVSLAEASETYGANVIPLVEDVGLDVLWLGLRVRGEGEARGATRSSDILMSATDVQGPGELVAYLTESLGQPNVYFNSADGFTTKDTTSLPPAAHTHLNWAFTKPGVYKLSLEAKLRNPGGKAPQPIGTGTFTFAVGVDPHTAAGPGDTILDDGHTDLTVNIDSGEISAFTDLRAKGGKQEEIPPGDVVIDVPNRALEKVPAGKRFAFLGEPGSEIYQLPQAVLGKHVHGEIDPHLWQDVQNAKAYTQLIRDTLKKEDPQGARIYDRNSRVYEQELDRLDDYVRARIGQIPAHERQLITTHDAFGYLADAYGMKVAGFVVPNPAQEPSADDVEKLSRTIKNLKVPAVFMEPNLVQRATVLSQVARDQQVRVCTLYGDAFDKDIRHYTDMMRHNADELRSCLGGTKK
ncbi:anchored repeat ABC transporter, substrate-binding protein [Streptomyces sp. SID8361]|uniref:anchored repeat ABC transporter, substrate-binding protein n=1 Tax=Streptomyces sp. MnatMP-M27 TaxID=1839768 RepID=UPI00081E3912|nr:anchored repeat ABC transporter, substrate-binding protein [Streptomyces sp. MnatMP-M27]MYU11661.1 anchored repeat ABC transporter, substrate-binding protein [Streptomyces sp. SID8361]SCF83675.1 anchored repeat ABC transporter, substrate-binding protein [Streptomyces sp. MnatMP-M27]